MAVHDDLDPLLIKSSLRHDFMVKVVRKVWQYKCNEPGPRLVV